MKNISAHDIYLFISFSVTSSSRLGVIVNNTKQTSDNDIPQCIKLFRTNDTNARNLMLTIIHGTLTHQ